jgi:hypothetical protein
VKCADLTNFKSTIRKLLGLSWEPIALNGQKSIKSCRAFLKIVIFSADT